MAVIPNLEKFKQWLLQNGAEVLPATNEYEVIRFKGRETGVIYSTGKTNGTYANNALFAFMSNRKWNGAPKSTGRKNTYVKEKRKLLDRDGSDCFYCGRALHQDITLEHLIPLTAGGKNELSNMVLAHEKCNNDQGFKPINEKVKFAIQNRISNILEKRK